MPGPETTRGISEKNPESMKKTAGDFIDKIRKFLPELKDIPNDKLLSEQNQFLDDLENFTWNMETDDSDALERKHPLATIVNAEHRPEDKLLVIHYENQDPKESYEVHISGKDEAELKQVYEAIFYKTPETTIAEQFDQALDQTFQTARTQRQDIDPSQEALIGEIQANEGQKEMIEESKKALATELGKKPEELTEKDLPQIQEKIQSYRTTLGQSSIEDIRYQSRLLIPKKDGESDIERIQNLKSETAKRLLAYTTEFEEGAKQGYFTDDQESWKNKWFTLNYGRVGGRKHELKIGLGDILLDLDINEIQIQKNGQNINAHRGTAKNPPKHRGRIGFVDDNGTYITTLDGDKFKILSGKGVNTNDKEQVAQYIKSYEQEEVDRSNHRKVFQEQERRSKSMRDFEYFDGSDIDKYMQHREYVKDELGFKTDILEHAKTDRVDVIPPKAPGAKRLVIFGDTNGAYGTKGQKYLKQLQNRIPEWDADMVLGVGDFISAGGGGVDSQKYQELVKHAKEEFAKFDKPMALSLGNHDIDTAGKSTDDLSSLYKETLLKEFNYQENFDKSAYSYELGGATFVVFNEGNKNITPVQSEFLEEISITAPGAVYLINHVPPIQHAFGPGLPKDGSERVKGFEEVQRIGKEIEDSGRNFYIISGHDHFHSVIGNFINPGGMASAYYGLDGKKLKSVPSAAVVDMDEKGNITAIHFRDARSDFKDPLPEIQHALAVGSREGLENQRKKHEVTLDPAFLELLSQSGTIDQQTIKTATEWTRTKKEKIDNLNKLVEHCPSLIKIIEFVAKNFDLPSSLLYTTIHHESAFKSGAGIKGDPHVEGGAVGLTQFIPKTWQTITNKPNFQAFMNKIYPGKTKYKRGESIVAAVAAAATLIKDASKSGAFNIHYGKNPSDYEIAYIRTAYKGKPRGISREEAAKKVQTKDLDGPYSDYLNKIYNFVQNCKRKYGASVPETLKIV